MATLRFLAALFALVAIFALIADLTPSLTENGKFQATPLGAHWADLSPSTLASTRAGLTQRAGPGVWQVFDTVVLSTPTFGLFAGLALAFGYAGRRRRRVNIYVN